MEGAANGIMGGGGGAAENCGTVNSPRHFGQRNVRPARRSGAEMLLPHRHVIEIAIVRFE
jgi:hypothetical protein